MSLTGYAVREIRSAPQVEAEDGHFDAEPTETALVLPWAICAPIVTLLSAALWFDAWHVTRAAVRAMLSLF